MKSLLNNVENSLVLSIEKLQEIFSLVHEGNVNSI